MVIGCRRGLHGPPWFSRHPPRLCVRVAFDPDFIAAAFAVYNTWPKFFGSAVS
jgi:hypothetical protein